MNSQTFFLTVYVLFATVATVLTLLWGLRSAIGRAELSPREQRRSFWTGTTLLVAWLFTALASSWLGFYQGKPTRVPTIEFGLLLPIIAGLMFYLRSSVLRRIAAAVPQTLLVGIQFYRLLGIIFLVLLAGGALTGVFALPAGTGDVAVGLAAPAVAFAFARLARFGRTGPRLEPLRTR